MAEISTVSSTRESRHREFENIDLRIGLFASLDLLASFAMSVLISQMDTSQFRG